MKGVLQAVAPVERPPPLRQEKPFTPAGPTAAMPVARHSGSLHGPEGRMTLHRAGIPGIVGGAVYFCKPRERIRRGRRAISWENRNELGMQDARCAGKDFGEAMRRVADGVSFFNEPSIGAGRPSDGRRNRCSCSQGATHGAP
jgi:hypothetical protein